MPVLPNTSGNSDNSSSELRYYLYVLRRRWWRVLLGALTVSGGALWRAARQIPRYTAEARVLRSPPENLLEAGWAGLYDLQPEAMAVQLNLITSHDVLSRAVDSLGLRLQLEDERAARSALFSEVYVHPGTTTAKYTVSANGSQVMVRAATGQVIMAGARGELLEGPGFRFVVTADHPLLEPVAFEIVTEQAAQGELEEGLRAEQVKQSMLIAIRYSDPDPVMAAAGANGVANAYKWFSGERARKDARERKNLLAARLRELRDSLRLAEMHVQSVNRNAGLAGMGAGESALSVIILETQGTVRDLTLSEQLMLELRRSLDAGSTDAVQRAIALGGENLGFKSAYERILALQSQRSRLVTSGNATERSQSVLAVDSQIVDQRNELRRVADANLRVIRERLESATDRLQDLRVQYGDLSSQMVVVGAVRQQVEALQRHHDMIAEKYYEAQIAEQLDNGSVEITQPAAVPTTPSGSRKTRSFFFALLIGTTLGIIAAFVLEQVDTRVRDPEDAQRAASAGVIGLIPELRGETGRPLALAADEQTLGAEAYRKLRTNLRFVRAERPRAIAITSPSPQEGKSVTAANLALAIAQQGQSVLIVDGDLRRPVQHEIFGAQRSPGLSDTLVGLIEPLAAVQPYAEMPNVFVMACGTEAPNPAELLGSDAFARFLQAMLDKFDTVIVDTPPVNLVTDAAVIGSVCDGVLLVAEAGHTDRSVLASSVNELRSARGSVLGIVLNRAGAGTRYGRYGKYGGYYSNRLYYKKESAERTANGEGQRLKNIRDWVSALI
ncbi:MAG: polysaccharide biosynthesis tyrosine autokinase [Gemmatimonadota bacterium]